MNRSQAFVAGLCILAVAFLSYEDYRARAAERQLWLARDESVKQEKRAAVAAETQMRALQNEVDILKLKTDNLGKVADEFEKLVAGAGQGQSLTVQIAAIQQSAKSEEGPPVPANSVMAERLITPISPEELARRVNLALQRTTETLTPVTQQDLANMPNTYEWGTGAERRMWRLVDPNTYLEVYPDGSYSVFPILGRATVNDLPGVIATKDDGMLEVFIPDQGGRMIHLIRSVNQGPGWREYRPMDNVK